MKQRFVQKPQLASIVLNSSDGPIRANHSRVPELTRFFFCESCFGGLKLGFGKRGLLEKGSFQKSPFSRDSRESRDSRDFREPPDCGKQRTSRPSSRDSREFREFRVSRDSSSEKTPFVMTPFSGPEKLRITDLRRLA